MVVKRAAGRREGRVTDRRGPGPAAADDGRGRASRAAGENTTNVSASKYNKRFRFILIL